MSEIPDDIFEALSPDPYMASFQLLDRLGKTVLAGYPDEAAYSAACGILNAFYDANNFKVPQPVSPRGGLGAIAAIAKEETADQVVERSRSNWRFQFEAYRTQIMGNHAHAVKILAKEKLSAITEGAFGYAILTKEEKQAIHNHIDAIRKIIDSSDLDDRKKNSLIDKLTGLSKEVDRNGTLTDRFFAFAGDLGFCLGAFAKNAKPLIKEVKEILKIVTRSRARNENIELPHSGEVLSLPEPEMKPAGDV